MGRVLLRMERGTEPLAHRSPDGVKVEPWHPASDRVRIPAIYAEAFGHDPWPDDWEGFAEFDPSGVFVASAGPDRAGFAICFARGQDGYISVVAVVPAIRRRGAATALVAVAIDYLRSLGLGRVTIDAYEDALAAVATYRAAGFEVYDRILDEAADPRGRNEE